MICKYCQKQCKNKLSLSCHERLCSNNPTREISNIEKRTNIVPWNKGLTKDTDDRVALNGKKVSSSLKGKPSKTIWTHEMRQAKSEWRKQLHKDNPDTHPNRRLAGNRNKMSYPEKVAFDFLTLHNVEFEHQKYVLKYFPDFVIGNIIIEIDGEHWHNEKKDRIRDAELAEQGFTVYRIKSKDQIENKLKEILRLV